MEVVTEIILLYTSSIRTLRSTIPSARPYPPTLVKCCLLEGDTIYCYSLYTIQYVEPLSLLSSVYSECKALQIYEPVPLLPVKSCNLQGNTVYGYTIQYTNHVPLLSGPIFCRVTRYITLHILLADTPSLWCQVFARRWHNVYCYRPPVYEQYNTNIFISN